MILVLFIALRFFAIFLIIYTLILIARFLTAPENPTEVGKVRQFEKTTGKYKNYITENQNLQKAFRTFGLRPDDSYSAASYRYYQMRRNVQNSPLPEQLKEGRLKELDELFDLLTEYYAHRSDRK
jgi:hypothetical protein